MLNAKANQFSLSAEGFLLWQAKPENPLPGQPVAKIARGVHVLRPVVEVLDNGLTKDIDKAALKTSLTLWLNTHIGSVLEPLVFLGVQDGIQTDDPVQAICKALYDSLGIVSREVLEADIARLDTEQRAVLRSRKIRLGPLLVFIPLLNKPAAVRLRGLLWSIDHGRPLPAPVPADGIVSMTIDETTADRDFFRAVGYPLYGGRAVRIDMLDRVINAVYDQAEKGRFRAQHQMAEWLGCPIADLYRVLESMGHAKIFDPAEEQARREAAREEGRVEAEAAAQIQAGSKVAAAEKNPENEAPAPQEKPELAVFRLKRGKAFQVGKPAGRNRALSDPGVPGSGTAGDRGSQGNDKSKASRDGFSEKRAGHQGKKARDKGRRPEKDFDRKEEREARVISFEVQRKAEDSPFAILQNLKVKGDE